MNKIVMVNYLLYGSDDIKTAHMIDDPDALDLKVDDELEIQTSDTQLHLNKVNTMIFKGKVIEVTINKTISVVTMINGVNRTSSKVQVLVTARGEIKTDCEAIG